MIGVVHGLPSEQPQSAHRESGLLERDRELGLLDGLVQAAQSGESTLALVEGPAGIGKSQLLSVTRQTAAAAGFRVLTARASDLER
ncbi:MAG: ATP-binding protein, partial [Candidatus Nanopelagicales bacterium]